jgi:hypothetical protein
METQMHQITVSPGGIQTAGPLKSTPSLPSSIEEFEIHFMLPHGVFAKGVGYHTQFARLPEKVQIKACKWIMEFAKHKEAGVMPHLKVLRLAEVSDFNVWRHFKPKKPFPSAETFRYELPSIVLDVLTSAGIVLDIEFSEGHTRPLAEYI